jgi:hypothetical protein
VEGTRVGGAVQPSQAKAARAKLSGRPCGWAWRRRVWRHPGEDVKPTHATGVPRADAGTSNRAAARRPAHHRAAASGTSRDDVTSPAPTGTSPRRTAPGRTTSRYRRLSRDVYHVVAIGVIAAQIARRSLQRVERRRQPAGVVLWHRLASVRDSRVVKLRSLDQGFRRCAREPVGPAKSGTGAAKTLV